jgi:micrococcal nuclease
MNLMTLRGLAFIFLLILAACEDLSTSTNANGEPPAGEIAQVTRVIDGDTIEVDLNGVGYRVRYLGVNTPESDEPCYKDATDANRNLVGGKMVTLVRDRSNTDRFGRLLRYVYVGSTFVNRELVRQGFAEAVLYPPDDAHFEAFVALEEEAKNNNLQCHRTGIFDDNNRER